MTNKQITGTLFVAATPIGNLGDITLRCLETLKTVDIVACEDTRTAKKLFTHFNINPPSLISYEEHSEEIRCDELIRHLKAGRNIAVISEGGTPLISDPGYRLVSTAASMGIRVVPIPGVSSVTAALSAAGCATDRFTFLGFLPRKEEERLKVLRKVSQDNITAVFFESPHRIEATLTDLNKILPDRKIILCRELTKIYEEFLRGTAEEISRVITEKGGLKGEITLIIEKTAEETGNEEITLSVEGFCDLLTIQADLPPSKAAAIAAKLFNKKKNDIYNLIIKNRRD